MIGKGVNYKGIVCYILQLATHYAVATQYAVVYRQSRSYDLTPDSGVVYREKKPTGPGNNWNATIIYTT
jgi:hypothetical protein